MRITKHSILRRIAAPLVGIVAIPALAGAQGAYQRPTTIIAPVGLPSDVTRALSAACGSNCAGTRLGDRTFSEGVERGITGDSTLMTKENATALLERLSKEGVTRRLILRQFLADKDFGWRNDTLVARASYSVSVTEANTMLRTQGGLESEMLRTIPANFVIAVHSTGVERKSGKDLFGKPTIELSAPLKVSVFQIGITTPDEARNSLGGFYCAPGCQDKDKRQAAFDAYVPPFTHVLSFSASASANSPEAEGDDKAFAALGSSILDELVTEMAAGIPSFASREKIVAVDPPAARIGKKEGIMPGARFFHYRAEQRADGTQIQVPRAVLTARKVADNRKSVIEAGAVGGKIASLDSTTFRQVYPGGVNVTDMIMEKPSTISLHAGVGMLEGNAGVIAEVRTEELAGSIGAPDALRAIVSFKTFAQSLEIGNESLRYRSQFIGVGLGYEFHPIRGKFRLMPLAMYNNVTAQPLTESSTSEDEGTFGIELGADFGLRVTQTIEITGMLRNSSYVDVLGAAQNGMVFGIGARLQRGRWGF